jgi:hypothetical protein
MLRWEVRNPHLSESLPYGRVELGSARAASRAPLLTNLDRVEYLLHGFVHWEVKRTEVDHLKVSVLDRFIQIQAKAVGPRSIFFGALFKYGHDSRLAGAMDV